MRRIANFKLMPVGRYGSRLLSALLLASCAGAFQARPLVGQQHDFWEDDGKATAVPGRRAFNSNCSPCHGLDGRGSDKGANIAGSSNVRHLSDAQISAIISNGTAGTGMPAFHSLTAPQIRAIVSYVRALQGKLEARTMPGDPARGKGVFFGKGECANCHSVSGEGGFLGPDLSGYGSAMSAQAIRDEILKTNRVNPANYRSAVIVLRDGDRLEGVIRNEDNFSVQLQTKNGGFHFLQKSDLQAVEHHSQSLMPTNYGHRLGSNELNDLVSYLMNGAALQEATTSHKVERTTK